MITVLIQTTNGDGVYANYNCRMRKGWFRISTEVD